MKLDANLHLRLYYRKHVTGVREAGIIFDPYKELPTTQYFQFQVLRLFSTDGQCLRIARAHFYRLAEENGFHYYVP